VNSPPLNFPRVRFLTATFFLASFVLPCLSAAQQPIPPTPPTAPQPPAAAPPPTQESSSTSKHKSKIPPFLIIGTVFNEHALAFPGVQVKIRRKGEKKFRYDTYTNSRGEFAIRVPDGIEYEVVIHQKNYQDQSQVFAANMADVQKRLTFKLESTKPAQPGEPK
jgi:Carboxypeptidase regulatory-like domain